jgi:hypothetical protein
MSVLQHWHGHGFESTPSYPVHPASVRGIIMGRWAAADLRVLARQHGCSGQSPSTRAGLMIVLLGFPIRVPALADNSSLLPLKMKLPLLRLCVQLQTL